MIRGGQVIEQRPFGSVATVQRIGLDLRYALDRSTYGNIFSLTMETGHYLKQVLQLLDAPDIKKAFDANTKWDVVEIVSSRHLGGIAEPSQRAKMAESGRRILQFIADNDFKTAIDPILFQSTVRPMIGVGKAINLPSLRTVHAVFPHTALQLAVPISGQIDDYNLLQGASVIATE